MLNNEWWCSIARHVPNNRPLQIDAWFIARRSPWANGEQQKIHNHQAHNQSWATYLYTFRITQSSGEQPITVLKIWILTFPLQIEEDPLTFEDLLPFTYWNTVNFSQESCNLVLKFIYSENSRLRGHSSFPANFSISVLWSVFSFLASLFMSFLYYDCFMILKCDV